MNLTQWSLEEKLGQLFICGFHSREPDEQIQTLVGRYHVGGIVYFRRNIKSAVQLADLSQSLQQLARCHQEVPLFISIDQEGGMVARLDHEGMSRIPGNMALGAANDPALTEEVAVLAAREMRALGINFNFAPCVDVNNNPANPVIGVRSFGEQPELAAVHGTAAIHGYQREGVIATAKHFPGHGDTEVDSHLGLASVPHDRKRLQQVELLPFRAAIEAGVDAIMTAHVIFPAFEPKEIPATLSRRVLTDLLRGELGYDGVIVTDCLEMQAIAHHFGVGEGAVRALEAGADLVLVSHTLADQVAAIEAVTAAVRSGRISVEQINRSVERVLALKQRRLGLGSSLPLESIPEAVTLPLTEEAESRDILRRVAERSVTLVRDAGSLPIRLDQPVLVVWPELRHTTEVDEPPVYTYTLADALEPLHHQVEVAVIGVRASEQEIYAVLERSAAFTQIVIATYTAAGELDPGQQALIQKLLQQFGDKRVIVVSTRSPYDLRAIPEVGTYLCLYENRPPALDAVAKVLAGRLQPQGILPVSLTAN